VDWASLLPLIANTVAFSALVAAVWLALLTREQVQLTREAPYDQQRPIMVPGSKLAIAAAPESSVDEIFAKARNRI
jgi:hypothetical protein